MGVIVGCAEAGAQELGGGGHGVGDGKGGGWGSVGCSHAVVNVNGGTSKKTILKYKNVSYCTQLCPMIATPIDAPNADVKQQIAQGHSQELKSSSSKSQVLRKTVSL